MSEENTAGTEEITSITINDFYNQLKERVSTYNARLLLNSVVFSTGLRGEAQDAPLKKEVVTNICMALINKGGPAFKVGQSVYNQVH